MITGTPKGLFRSNDAGDSWVRIYEGLSLGSQYFDISISPFFKDDKTVYVGTDGEGVFRSLDSGLSWEPTNLGLKGMIVTGLSIGDNYSREKTLYAGTSSRGLFMGSELEAGPFFEPVKQSALPGEYTLLGWLVVFGLLITVIVLSFLVYKYRKWSRQRKSLKTNPYLWTESTK